uniref:Uncharacterized protein n=1 Tax=Heliothis virescens TaxID=7102 RepID=A0A2A4JFE0_HELVI
MLCELCVALATGGAEGAAVVRGYLYTRRACGRRRRRGRRACRRRSRRRSSGTWLPLYPPGMRPPQAQRASRLPPEEQKAQQWYVVTFIPAGHAAAAGAEGVALAAGGAEGAAVVRGYLYTRRACGRRRRRGRRACRRRSRRRSSGTWLPLYPPGMRPPQAQRASRLPPEEQKAQQWYVVTFIPAGHAAAAGAEGVALAAGGAEGAAVVRGYLYTRRACGRRRRRGRRACRRRSRRRSSGTWLPLYPPGMRPPQAQRASRLPPEEQKAQQWYVVTFIPAGHAAAAGAEGVALAAGGAEGAAVVRGYLYTRRACGRRRRRGRRACRRRSRRRSSGTWLPLYPPGMRPPQAQRASRLPPEEQKAQQWYVVTFIPAGHAAAAGAEGVALAAGGAEGAAVVRGYLYTRRACGRRRRRGRRACRRRSRRRSSGTWLPLYPPGMRPPQAQRASRLPPEEQKAQQWYVPQCAKPARAQQRNGLPWSTTK